MAYTDKQMQEASLLAYIEIDPVADKNKTMKQIIESHPEYLQELQNSVNKLGPGVDREQYQARLNLLTDIKNGKSECANWIVREPVDHAETTGFAACVYETDKGEAIVAFRGSNSGDFETHGEDNPGQLQHDWIENDFGLQNCKETPQQAEAKKYMEQLYRKYGDRYEYGVTGHSLGGNLAESAAIEAPEGMQKLIKQVVSMDGPGFSQEYIDAHQAGIKRMSDKMVHYQWSPIGCLLQQPGNAQTYTAGVVAPPRIQDYLKYIMFRHDSCFVRFDEHGNIIRVPSNPFYENLHHLTLGWDNVTFLQGPWAIGELLVYRKLLGPIFPVVRELSVGVSYFLKKKKKKSRSKYKNVDFVFNCDCMTAVEDETMYLSSELYDIADELSTITSKISSISLSSVKVSGRTLSNRITSDGKKLKKMGNTIEKIIKVYQNTEDNLSSSVQSI